MKLAEKHELSVDDALIRVLTMPRSLRVAVMALVGYPDADRFEGPRIDAYIGAVTELAEHGELADLTRAIHAVQGLMALNGVDLI